MDTQQREQALHHLKQAIVLVLELARQLEVLPDVAPAPAPAVPMFDRPRALFLREAARDARCGQHTIRRAIAAGQLEARRVSGKLRIEPDELERWSQQREAGVAANPSVDKPATKSAPPSKARKAKAPKRKGKAKLRIVKAPKSVQASPHVSTAEEMIADAVLVGERAPSGPWEP